MKIYPPTYRHFLESNEKVPISRGVAISVKEILKTVLKAALKINPFNLFFKLVYIPIFNPIFNTLDYSASASLF